MVVFHSGLSFSDLSIRIINHDQDIQKQITLITGVMSTRILDIISDMPSYGSQRVRGILRKQRRTE